MSVQLSRFSRSLILLATFLFSMFFPSWALALLLLAAAILVINRKTMPGDRRFVLTVVCVAIMLKLIIMTAYFNLWLLQGKQDLIGPDGEGFSQRGWYISKVLSGKVDYAIPSKEFVYKGFYRVVDYYKRALPPFNSRANGLFTYVIGITYFFLGYTPLLVKIFNIAVSAVSSLVIYLLAIELFGNKPARLSLLLFTFFPSIFVFSISSLRDPLIIFCILTFIYALVKINHKITIGYLAVLSTTLALVLFLREEIFIILCITAILNLFLIKNFRYKIITAAAIIAVMAFAANSEVFYKIRMKDYASLDAVASRILWRNAGLYKEGGNLAFKVFPNRYYEDLEKYPNADEYANSPDRITFKEMLYYLPGGILNYIARPVPFVKDGMIYKLISINTFAWYLIFILAVPGIIMTASRPAIPIYIFIAIILALASLVEANEGILLRHRDTVIPFFIIFSSGAIIKLILKDE